MNLSRREMLEACAGAAAAILLNGGSGGAREAGPPEAAARVRTLRAAGQTPLLTRRIPSSEEPLPIIGLGSAGQFGGVGSDGDTDALREVLRRFHAAGGRVFDTAPTYGEAERVSGRLARELGIADELFYATKISTPLAFVSDVMADWSRQEGAKQWDASRQAWGRDVIDLQQIHNLQGVAFHLPVLREAKAAGRARYIGVTVQAASMYADLERVMQAEQVDFVQCNYSLAEREAAARILPLARDRGCAVIINEPFNGEALFAAVRGRELPEWAAEFDCASWGQFFLKYIVAPPAVTVAIPATSNPAHLDDNIGAGKGRLPDDATRRRMEQLIDSL